MKRIYLMIPVIVIALVIAFTMYQQPQGQPTETRYKETKVENMSKCPMIWTVAPQDFEKLYKNESFIFNVKNITLPNGRIVYNMPLEEAVKYAKKAIHLYICPKEGKLEVMRIDIE